MRITKALAFGLLLVTGAAYAAEIDGDWVTSFETPNGAVEIKYTLKADGNTLTGTSTGPDGRAIPLKDGKIDGDTISFALDLDFGQGPMTFHYTGTVSGGEIKVTSEFNGQPFDFTLKRPATT